ncbi:myb-related protein 2 [Cinnamomum micranthum f. kanehirae]|uniref:Myb-related protein 2 n=1 Tax=Cinnamomum micranthum f. kanehirae TaxID=337451 RepID=A0A443NMX9_9MAGN|nr:myb-related protein 2 [Cinnamomum micranthum f. kanehirae]
MPSGPGDLSGCIEKIAAFTTTKYSFANAVIASGKLRIEAQGKYLQSVLEKAQETLGRQNLGSTGLEAAKVQLSELVSRVSNECLNSAFSELKDISGLCSQQSQTKQIADCSVDNCLTCEGSQKDQEMHNVDIGLINYNSDAPFRTKETGEDSRLGGAKFAWCEDLNESKMFSLQRIMFPIERNSSDLSMRTGVRGEKESSNTISKTKRERRDAMETELSAIQQENKKPSEGLGLTYITGQLDLNAYDENDVASSRKQFDFNGFSWN